MPWAAAAAIGGALITSSATQDAADTQAASAQAGVAEQQREFDTVQQLLSPFITAAVGSPAAGAPTVETEAQIRARLAPQYAQNAAVSASNGASTGGAEGGASGGSMLGNLSPAQWAAFLAARGITDPALTAGSNPALDAAVQAELQRQQAAAAAASSSSGAQTTGALPAYLNLIGLNGDAAQQAAIASIQNGSQFGSLAKQGEDAILQNASATGGLRGGNVQGALATNRENLLNDLINQQLQRYGGIVQMGQNSAAGVGSAALTTGQGISNLLQQQGAAQAGGTLAANNAITNALGNVGGLLAGSGSSSSSLGALQASLAQTGLGSSGFGTGLVYGNQDYGQYF